MCELALQVTVITLGSYWIDLRRTFRKKTNLRKYYALLVTSGSGLCGSQPSVKRLG